MDDTDSALLALLKANARLSVAALAQALGLARTTVQSRIERLERQGVITGYTVKLSAAATPPLIRATALVIFRVTNSCPRRSLSWLKRMPEHA